MKRRRYRRLGVDWDDATARRAYNAEKMRRYRAADLRHFVASARIFGISIGKHWQDVAARLLR